jgi:hypothetical protein
MNDPLNVPGGLAALKSGDHVMNGSVVFVVMAGTDGINLVDDLANVANELDMLLPIGLPLRSSLVDP